MTNLILFLLGFFIGGVIVTIFFVGFSPGTSSAYAIKLPKSERYVCPHGYEDSDQCPDCCH